MENDNSTYKIIAQFIHRVLFTGNISMTGNNCVQVPLHAETIEFHMIWPVFHNFFVLHHSVS